MSGHLDAPVALPRGKSPRYPLDKRLGGRGEERIYDSSVVQPVVSGLLIYVGVLISIWLFLFAAQPKEFFMDVLKKLKQQSHKCVELRGEYAE
jgi:hypothetical protein